jgi:hypothetical protein
MIDRALIPKKNLIEVKYTNLDKNPLLAMQRIYNRLNFWPFARVRGRMRRYLDSLKGYKKNRYRLSPTDIANVNRHWAFAFYEWGYPFQAE